MSERSFPYGPLNGHAVGIIMKELVRRAIVAIREERMVHEVMAKVGASKLNDVVTSADKAAQRAYLRSLRECFPYYGLVAEEDNVKILSGSRTELVYFTVDPLDGTAAFVRRQSHGVGTMIALVHDQEVVAAYVGDVMTQEVYGYRPDSDAVHRISEFETSEPLEVDLRRSLADQFVLIREEPSLHSSFAHDLVSSVAGGAFRGVEVTGGSIGIAMARLWKGEVGAALLRPTVQTPWDLAPIVGISKKLGFRFLYLIDEEFQEFDPLLSMESYRTEHEMLIVHKGVMPELAQWLRNYRARD